jgi:hypothetical protein
MAVTAILLVTALAAPTAVAVENRLPDGTHDGFDLPFARRGECYANGWAVDPDDPEAAVTVQIIVDGVVVAQVEATEYRQDIVDAGIDPAGTAGFTVFMGPLGIGFDVEHTVLVKAQDPQTGEWRDLDGSPRTLTCTNVNGFHDGNEGIVAREDCIASGWALDHDSPSGPRARVRVKVDGKVVGETTASQFRQDVLDAGIGDGFSGWSVDLFGSMTPGVEHLVTAEARDTDLKRVWLPVFGTDRHMTCLAHQPLTWDPAFDFRRWPDQANPTPDRYGNQAVWSYMQSAGFDHDPSQYMLLPDFAGPDVGREDWYNDEYGNLIVGYAGDAMLMHAWGGRVQSDIRSSILAWRSPVGGRITVTGSATVEAPCGDGVIFWIDRHADSLESAALEGGRHDFDLEITVSPGTTLYFGVDPGFDSNCDSTYLQLTISQG